MNSRQVDLPRLQRVAPSSYLSQIGVRKHEFICIEAKVSFKSNEISIFYSSKVEKYIKSNVKSENKQRCQI